MLMPRMEGDSVGKEKSLTLANDAHRVANMAKKATVPQLTRARKRANIGLRELAAALGISAPYLCDLEKGRRNGEKAQEQIERAVAVLREIAAARRVNHG